MKQFTVSYCIPILILLLPLCLIAQQSPKPQLKPTLAEQAGDIVLDDTIPQIYRLTTNWHNRDLYGNSIAHFMVSGQYTRGLGEGLVRWNNVLIEIFSE